MSTLVRGMGIFQLNAVAVTTTWNAADVGPNTTLDGSKLIATKGAPDGFNSFRAIASASAGKKYWEMTLNVFGGTAAFVGLANASAVLTTYVGNTGSYGHWNDGTNFINNGSAGPALATFVVGDTVCIAVDLTAAKIWSRVNGGGWNNDIIANQNPATNTGGTDISTVAGPYFAAGTFYNINDQWTGNFGATSYAQAVPSGFGNW